MVLNSPPFALLSLKRYGIQRAEGSQGRQHRRAGRRCAARGCGRSSRKNVGVARRQRHLDQHGAAAARAGPREGRRQGDLRLLLHRLPQPDREPQGPREPTVVAFKYSDYGIDLYGNAVVVRVDWLKANEDTVRRFLAALNTRLQGRPQGSAERHRAHQGRRAAVERGHRAQAPAARDQREHASTTRSGATACSASTRRGCSARSSRSSSPFELGAQAHGRRGVHRARYLPPASERKLD